MGTIQHIKSVTIGDSTNTDQVRPSDWNSAHNYTLQDAVSILAGNTAGTLANISSGTLYLAGGNNITLSQNANSVTVQGPPSMSFLEPFDWNAANSATTTFNSGTAFFLPFLVPNNASFKQLNIIASASLASTSAANTMTVSFATSGRSQGFTANATIGGSNLVDFYLLSQGAGGSSTDLQTVSTTQISFVTSQFHTYAISASAATSTATVSLSSSVSLSVVFPAMTSGTTTSVNAGTTITTWGVGYGGWTSSIANSTSSSKATSATISISISQAWPATTAWASNKLIAMPFAVTLPGGMYWLGINRETSTSSSLSTANNNILAGQSYTSAVNASNLTFTGQLTYAGFTGSIVNSLGYLGAGVAGTLAPAPGHGTFSATYSPATTYYNNAGQQSGEIALSDINTNVSFWKVWMQWGNNRI